MTITFRTYHRIYGQHILNYEYGAARNVLFEVLQNLEFELSGLQDKDVNDNLDRQSFILQLIGETFFYEDNIEQAINYYKQSVELVPTSLLAKYLYAKFLAEKVKDARRVIAICEEIVEVADKYPYDTSEEDQGSEEYKRKAAELVKWCAEQQIK